MSLNYRDAITVSKLDGGENYESWQSMISGSLASSGGWKFVDNTTVLPKQEVDEKHYLCQARLEAYHAQAAHARMVIITSCKPHIQSTLAKVPTAHECWEKLKQLYQPQGLVQKHISWREYNRMQYQGEDMESFGTKYQDALERCSSAGIQIDLEIQTLNFLGILENHYEHWTDNKYEQMRQNPNQQIPLDRLILEAKEEWKRKQERATLQLHLNTTARIPSQRKELCAYCRLPNHKEDTCYYKHVHLRKPGWQPNSITMQKIQERTRGAVNLQSSNHSFLVPLFSVTMPEGVYDLLCAVKRIILIFPSITSHSGVESVFCRFTTCTKKIIFLEYKVYT
ncbi:unnamed protein product [Calypogeia fissa]